MLDSLTIYRSTDKLGKSFLAVLLSMTLQLVSVAFQRVSAQDDNNCDHQMLLETKLLKDYLKFPDSEMGKFYKISASLCDKDGKNPKLYEDLYACSKLGDRPALVGCKRHSRLELIEKPHITILLALKQPEKGEISEEEMQAAALAITPLSVGLHLMSGKDKIVYASDVKVPIASFEGVKQGLMAQGFQSASQSGTPTKETLEIILMSDPKGQYEKLFYQPALKKKS